VKGILILNFLIDSIKFFKEKISIEGKFILMRDFTLKVPFEASLLVIRAKPS
jgi:hypothetical protein